MSEFTAELIGTMILIIFGGGVVATNILNKSKGNGGGWVLITIGWGLAVALAVYAVGSVSGAHVNPAVTLAFAAIGDFPWDKVPAYLSAQLIGAIIGAIIVFFAFLPHWRETEDQGTKLGVFATGPAVRSPLANMVTEMIGTFVLILGLLFIGINEFTEGLNPLVVGLLIVAIGMSIGGPTGYAINPARDLGPRIAHAILPIPGKGNSDWGYAWIPIAGPIVGGIYGAFFYKAFFDGDFSVGFWVWSAIVAIILLAAASTELSKGNKAIKKVSKAS
ncbi:MIP/aquaporin family protein [Ornithinibacillus halotolerans]|uniref:Glycerol uptake facilitator protein n=1 Tax=Ornithinibacillus halotolerans TaxID=1274357 RepID=A0A916SD35_9BACI|nr:MIP/aquaporin family protein [Ornithinibacillus halotolerans]GGA91955.1 glycerol uptake facilitator protein [Ornithinibacillus halotolerans]